MNKYLVEFVGTFFLVVTVGAAAVGGLAPAGFAPLAIGSVLMVMIFAGGHVSGAHYNPAVTTAVTIRGKAAPADFAGYVVAQVLAGVVAALAARFLAASAFAGDGVRVLTPDIGPALLAEFLFTFALAWVVLNVATAKGTSGNSFYGLAIGFTVLSGAYAVGSVSGGVFNPAVAVGLGVMGKLAWSTVAMYVGTEIVAGAAAALAFKTFVKE